MSNSEDMPLDVWMDGQARSSAAKLALAVSATSLVKAWPGLLQTIHPAKGSVVAAPQTLRSESEPDYFFHWLRDSALIMQAGLTLIRRGIDAALWRQCFDDFVAFSLGLTRIDGRSFVLGERRALVAPGLRQYLRSDEEIAAVQGDLVASEARYNADGTLDVLQWGRPQHDGPALRALAALRFLERGPPAEPAAAQRLATLIEYDLDYTCRHAGAPGHDIWEEALGVHYYTTLVQFAALKRGASWREADGRGEAAEQLHRTAGRLAPLLADFWCAERAFYRSRRIEGQDDAARGPDSAVILGVLHAGLEDGDHSLGDPEVHTTLQALDDLFATHYAINAGSVGTLFGRYRGDQYFGGNPWYICTFAAAEACYRSAVLNPDAADAFIARGDRILTAIRRFVPRCGDLSEQLERASGAETSARNLSWSHAAFITAWDARKSAVA